MANTDYKMAAGALQLVLIRIVRRWSISRPLWSKNSQNLLFSSRPFLFFQSGDSRDLCLKTLLSKNSGSSFEISL